MENSTDAAARLKREGRWEDFSRRKGELEAAGASKKDAHVRALLEFAPLKPIDALPGQVQTDFGAAPPVLGQTTEYKETLSYKDAVSWVFDNMDVDNVNWKTCPSSGAFSMLKMVRENAQMRFEFFKSIMPRLLPSKSELERGEDRQTATKRVLTILDQVAAFSLESKGQAPAKETPVKTEANHEAQPTRKKARHARAAETPPATELERAVSAGEDTPRLPERDADPQGGQGGGRGDTTLPLPGVPGAVGGVVVGTDEGSDSDF